MFLGQRFGKQLVQREAAVEEVALARFKGNMTNDGLDLRTVPPSLIIELEAIQADKLSTIMIADSRSAANSAKRRPTAAMPYTNSFERTPTLRARRALGARNSDVGSIA